MVLILIKKKILETKLRASIFPAHLVGSFHYIEMPTTICTDALNIRSADCANIFKLQREIALVTGINSYLTGRVACL